MARWMMWVGIGVLVAGMITIGLALYFFGGTSFAAGGSFELLYIGVIIAVPGLVLLGLGGALRFVAALLLGVGILGIALDVGNTLVRGSGYLSSPVGYLMNWGMVWGVPSLALGLGLLVVWWQSGRPSPSPTS